MDLMNSDDVLVLFNLFVSCIYVRENISGEMRLVPRLYFV